MIYFTKYQLTSHTKEIDTIIISKVAKPLPMNRELIKNKCTAYKNMIMAEAKFIEAREKYYQTRQLERDDSKQVYGTIT